MYSKCQRIGGANKLSTAQCSVLKPYPHPQRYQQKFSIDINVFHGLLLIQVYKFCARFYQGRGGERERERDRWKYDKQFSSAPSETVDTLVTEWSGRCLTRFYFCRPNQHKDSRHTQSNIHSERGPQRKQANDTINSICRDTTNSAKFAFPRPSSTTAISTLHNQLRQIGYQIKAKTIIS